MENFEIIILGAGASGCFCALTAGEKGKKILLIDKLSRAGKKLMATGNGRCNLTNKVILPSEKFYNQTIDKYISRFDNVKTLEYFNNIGLETIADQEGRVYPFSNSAKSVIDVINNQLKSYENITLSLENQVEKIEKIGEKFIVYTSNGKFSCQKLVVAMGSKSGEEIIKTLKIKHKPFVPCLIALKTQSTRSLDGIKLSNVKIEAVCGEKRHIENGEILFKDSGVSGIVIFNASSIFARSNNFSGSINIDLMPHISHEELTKALLKRRKINVKISNFFDGMFVPQIGYYILNNAKIQNEERDSSALSIDEIKSLVNAIKKISLSVKGHYENNQIYSGGVKLDELTDDLESKQVKNLFFCGEICDVDGICGGYNLQWAWTSGRIVGEKLSQK